MSQVLADELRVEAASVLRPLADLAAPVRPGSSPSWEELIRVREHDVLTATTGCPASLAHDGEFDGWRTAFARRRLGTAVLERLRRHPTTPPGTAAAEVVSALADTGSDSLARWLGEIGEGGRAAAIREATSYAVAARTALAGGAWPPLGTRFVADAVAFRWNVPGRAVRLEAAVSAIATHRGERGAARSLLVLQTAAPDEERLRTSVAWLALVATLEAGRPPLRVTALDLAGGGRRSFSVTDDVLDDGLTAAAAGVEAAVAVRFGVPETRPERARCGRCKGVLTCPDASDERVVSV